MTDAEMAKAFKDGCPPEVAVRVKFKNAMDRAWTNLGEIAVRKEVSAYKIACLHDKARYWDKNEKVQARSTYADVILYPVFRTWFAAECECGRLYCARIYAA